MTLKKHTLQTTAALVTTALLLSACGSRDSDDEPEANPQQAGTPGSPSIGGETRTVDYGFAFTRTPDFTSGQIERISLTDGNIVNGTYPSTESNYVLASNGNDLFQLGRFNIDTLTSYSPTDTSAVNYQVLLRADEAETTSAAGIAFVDEDLAYVTQRSSDKILIIDPTPEQPTRESVILGEISIAEYNLGPDDALDYPDMTDAVVVDNKLFVLLENLTGFTPVNRAYIVVIDTVTGLEIPTGMGQFPLDGIELQSVNPGSLQYNEESGQLYVIGRGYYYADDAVTTETYTGGVESIDPVTYQSNLLIDDGTTDNNNGYFFEGVVVNENLGYLISLEGENNTVNNLRSFNPSTGELSDPIPGTEGQSLTTLAVGPDNHLWVGIQSDTPGYMRINLESGEVVSERVATTLIPSDTVFITVEE